jgi:hypothetical protein
MKTLLMGTTSFFFRCVWIDDILDYLYCRALLVWCDLLNTDFQFGGIWSELNAWYVGHSVSNQHSS